MHGGDNQSTCRNEQQVNWQLSHPRQETFVAEDAQLLYYAWLKKPQTIWAVLKNVQICNLVFIANIQVKTGISLDPLHYTL